MPQFQTEIPNPLGENEPELLTPGGMRTPTIQILFLVFICQHRLKCPGGLVQGNDISGSKRIHRQGSEKQLIDCFAARGPDGSLRLGPWMGCDDDPCALSDRG
jgi:hypothetical protein